MDIYQHIFECNPDPLIALDGFGKIVLVNASTLAMFGYTEAEMVGQTVEFLIPSRYATQHVGNRKNYANDPQMRRMGASELALFAKTKSGREFSVDIMLNPMVVDGIHFVLCAVRDVSRHQNARTELKRRTDELEALHKELKELASRDSLTGLYNRRTFHEHAQWQLKDAARRDEAISFLMLDIDFFKRINDQYGHAEGDRVLKAIAHTLQGSCRQNDVLARVGGEEFALLLPDTNVPGSVAMAEKIRLAVTALEGLHEKMTVSLGAVTFTPETSTIVGPELFAQLFEKADHALYNAKRLGRNQVCQFDQIVASQSKVNEDKARTEPIFAR